MHEDRSFSGLYLDSGRPDARLPSLWHRIVGGMVMVGVFALALTVSIVLFAVVLTVGAIVWGYLWWKTRALRKAMREHMNVRTAEGGRHSDTPQPGPAGTRSVIIEGEADVVDKAAERDRTMR